jgi:hypothetical protein
MYDARVGVPVEMHRISAAPARPPTRGRSAQLLSLQYSDRLSPSGKHAPIAPLGRYLVNKVIGSWRSELLPQIKSLLSRTCRRRDVRVKELPAVETRAQPSWLYEELGRAVSRACGRSWGRNASRFGSTVHEKSERHRGLDHRDRRGFGRLGGRF